MIIVKFVLPEKSFALFRDDRFAKNIQREDEKCGRGNVSQLL